MATTLTKPIYRETAGTYNKRPAIIGLLPGDVISFRPKGRRTEVYLHIEQLELLARMTDASYRYNEAMQKYQARQKAGVKGLRKPRKPNFSMISRVYREAYEHKPKTK